MKMNPKLMTIALLAAACCLFLGVNVARADDNEQGGNVQATQQLSADDNEQGDDNDQGGDIEGTEQLDVDILMTPTAAAPPGSSIELQLESEDDEGSTQATLTLEAQGLPPGTFNVSVTLKSTHA